MILVIFGLLLIGHALMDGPLMQPAALSRAKRGPDWVGWLGLHAGLHGLAVGVVTLSPGLGLAEMAAHAAIDYLKINGRIGSRADQALHVGCKVIWAVIASL